MTQIAKALNWETEEAERLRRGLVLFCRIAIVIFLAFWGLDLVVYPELAGEFLLLRLGCAAGYVPAIFVIGRVRRAGLLAVIGTWLVWWVSAFVCVMLVRTQHERSLYYSGLVVTILGMGLVIPWTWRNTLIAGLGIAAMFLGVAAMNPDAHLQATINNACFILGAVGIALAANLRDRRLTRADFAAREELAVANASLKELDTAKNRFFANVSHELRTPITLILAPLDEALASDKSGADALSTAHLLLARRNALKLLRLVDDILDLTRLESTSLRLRRESVHVGSLVLDLVTRSAPLARRKGLELKANEGKGELRISADAGQIEKVVLNLLANALKFTDHGSVDVEVAAHDGGVEIAVRDTGIGIPEAEIPLVFDRFHQVDAGSTRKHSGTGIGLALVKEVVGLHGGRISVESVVGQGTTIKVWLPYDAVLPKHAVERRSKRVLVDQDRREARGLPEWHAQLREGEDYRFLHVEAATERRVAPRPILAPTKALRVLVVEDNPDMSQLIVGVLSVEYDTMVAIDGEQGLALAGSKMPDLIVSDVMMPKLNGFDMVRALRDDPATRHIPTILLTARGQVEDRIAGREGGADAHLTKPFRPEELRATVRDLLTKQGQQVIASRDERDSAMRLLAEGIAHEVLNPLGFVQNAFFALSEAVEELRHAEPGSADFEELDQRIEVLYQAGREGIVRTRVAVDELRRMGDGATQLPAALDVNDAVTKVSNLASVRKELHIKQDLGATRQVNVPPGQVEKILLNLVQNAEHASEGEAVVTIKTWDAEGGVCVSVADRGTGIPRELIEKIFHPYFTTKPPDEGSGLGLALCRQIARDIGGRLDVDSEPGKGSTFTLWLPALAPEGPTSRSETAVSGIRKSAARLL